MDLPAPIIAFIERSTVPLTVGDAERGDCPLMLVNRAFEELTGYDRSEVIGRNCRFMQQSARDQHAEREQIRKAITNHAPTQVVLKNFRKDGSGFYNLLFLNPIRGDHTETLWYLGSQFEVKEGRRETDALEHMETVETGIKTAIRETQDLRLTMRRSLNDAVLMTIRSHLRLKGIDVGS